MARPAAIVFAAPRAWSASRWRLPGAPLPPGSPPGASPGEKSRQECPAQLVTLPVVGSLGAIKQRLDLAMQFVLGRLHALASSSPVVVPCLAASYSGSLERSFEIAVPHYCRESPREHVRPYVRSWFQSRSASHIAPETCGWAKIDRAP